MYAKKEETDEKTTVTKVIEEVKEQICDEYCKYLDVIKCVHMTSTEYETWLNDHCEECPLSRL